MQAQYLMVEIAVALRLRGAENGSMQGPRME